MVTHGSPRVKGFFLKYNISDLLWTDTVCMGGGGRRGEVLPFFPMAEGLEAKWLRVTVPGNI